MLLVSRLFGLFSFSTCVSLIVFSSALFTSNTDSLSLFRAKEKKRSSTMLKSGASTVLWTCEESLRLLTLFDADVDWSECAEKLSDEFAPKRPSNFFTAKSCKEEFDRVISTSHPEHFLRQKGDSYSQKELAKAWIAYMQKKVKADAAREAEMLLIKMREKAEIFNRIFSKDNPLSDEEVARLLEEARLEDSKAGKHDREVISREMAVGMEKIAELQALHEADPEKYPPLRISIPPSRPSASSAHPFSPIRPLFDSPTLPLTSGDSKTETSPQVSASIGMSLRSASQSPQKTSLTSPQKESKTHSPQKTMTRSQQEPSLRSPQRHAVGALQKNVIETSEEQHIASWQKTVQRSSQRSGTGSPQKPVRTISSESPPKSASLVGSPRSSIGSPRCVALPIEDIVVESPVKMEVDDGLMDEGGSRTDMTDTRNQANGAHCNILTSVVATSEEMKGEVQQDEHSQPRNEEKSVERRHLRAMGKVSSPPESPNSRSLQRAQRLSPRKPPNEVLVKEESGNRKSSTSAQTTGQTSSDGPPSQSVRSRRTVENNDEGEEVCHNRRRSDRRRGVESTTVVSDETSISRKRLRGMDEAADGERSDEESPKGSAVKRRRLSFREADSEATEKNEGQGAIKIVESHMEIQSSPEPEKHEEATKKTKEVMMPEKESEKCDKLTTRRGSLRSASVREKEPKRDEAHDVAEEYITNNGQGVIEVVNLESESDEEMTLGDIRSGIVAAKKEEQAFGKNNVKSDETPIQKPVESGSGKKKSVEKHRGRPRRERSGRESSPKTRLDTSRTTHTSSARRHQKKEELDETSIEQKAFLTSVWRMVSSHRHAAIFAQPVSDSIARGYSKVVKSRMDLATLKKQLDAGKVTDMIEFKRRLLLMFANAVMFNSTGHDVNNYAKEMAADALSSLKAMQKDILGIKEGAHLTRRAAAAEEASLERRRRSTYLTVTSIASAEKGEMKDKEKGSEREKEVVKVKEGEKDDERKEKNVEEGTTNGESSKRQQLVRHQRAATAQK
uniref:Bromo domain-containing protein n=1 Tax=Parascaris univalens TaxID=6257 RepID=A0A914ZRK4_PARUN